MHLCRFDDDKLGLVDGDVVCDVTEALDRTDGTLALACRRSHDRASGSTQEENQTDRGRGAEISAG
jgi:hypothetical protein